MSELLLWCDSVKQVAAVPGDSEAGCGSGSAEGWGLPSFWVRQVVQMSRAVAGQLQPPQCQGRGLVSPLGGCAPRLHAPPCKEEASLLGRRGDSRAEGQVRGQLWAPGPLCTRRAGQLLRLPQGGIQEGRRAPGGHPESEGTCRAEARAPGAGKPAQCGL